MNNFLLNQLVYNLDVEARIEFIRKCNYLLLNDEIFSKETYHINNIDLTFNLLVSICKFYNENTNKKNQKITERLKEINLKRIYFPALITLSEKQKAENKTIIKNLYKEYYDICEKCNWNEEILKKSRKKAKILDNISSDNFTFSEVVILNENRVEQIIEYGSFYAKEILNKNRSKKVRQIINTNTYELFSMILNENDKDKIIEHLILHNRSISIDNLKILIPSFIQNYSVVENINDKEKLQKIEKELEIKLDTMASIVLNKINTKLHKEKSIDENVVKHTKKIQNEKIEKYIRLFMEGEYRNIKQFCHTTHMAITTFKEYVKALEIINPELYKEVNEKIKLLEKMNKSAMNNELQKIVQYVKNGILLEDGTTREFDILDCYELTNIPLINMRSLLNKSSLSYEELNIIREFLNKYRNFRQITADSIYKERYIKLINNELYEVTTNEKETVIEYLENNGIPLLNITYNLALKKLLNGNLNIKQKVKTI